MRDHISLLARKTDKSDLTLDRFTLDRLDNNNNNNNNKNLEYSKIPWNTQEGSATFCR